MIVKICYANAWPDAPDDELLDDLFYTEYDFAGTLEEAFAEAQRISSQIYQGKYHWWIKDTGDTLLSVSSDHYC